MRRWRDDGIDGVVVVVDGGQEGRGGREGEGEVYLNGQHTAPGTGHYWMW